MSTANPKKSLFIAIEGIDFSGKTTLIDTLRETLRSDSLINEYFDRIIYTKEPNSGASEFCRQLRQMAVNNLDINDLTRALIFFASRSEHVSKIIEPARRDGGCLIICDRFYLSTLVYQIKRNEMLLDWARRTQRLICPRAPDITYFIRINKELFLRRYENGIDRERNGMDEMAYEHFDEISGLYEWFINDFGDTNIGPIRHLSGEGDEILPLVRRVQGDIREMVMSFLTGKTQSTCP